MLTLPTPTVLDHYRIGNAPPIRCGFTLTAVDTLEVAVSVNAGLTALPVSIWRAVDLKTTSAIVSAFLAEKLAKRAGAIVNPFQKGRPTIVPTSALTVTETELMNYSDGFDIKATCGSIRAGLQLPPCSSRCKHLNAITWQSHHRDVRRLLGIIWDYFLTSSSAPVPAITAAFYAGDLDSADWGNVSGAGVRSAKVCGMTASGKRKMGAGALFVLDHSELIERYKTCIPNISL